MSDYETDKNAGSVLRRVDLGGTTVTERVWPGQPGYVPQGNEYVAPRHVAITQIRLSWKNVFGIVFQFAVAAVVLYMLYEAIIAALRLMGLVVEHAVK